MSTTDQPNNDELIDKEVMDNKNNNDNSADKTVFRKPVETNASNTNDQPVEQSQSTINSESSAGMDSAGMDSAGMDSAGNNTATVNSADEAKTVFRKPISDTKAQEIAKSVARAKAKAKAEKDSSLTPSDPTLLPMANDDRTVFSPRTPPEQKPDVEPELIPAQANDSDKTVFAKPLSSKAVTSAPQYDDATRFSPSVQQNSSTTTNTGDDNTGSAFDLITNSVSTDELNTHDVNAGTADNSLSTSNEEAINPSNQILKGRFVLEDILGIGGMGVVYKAKDLLKVEAHDKDPYVAIKVLSEEFRTHPEAFISLQREAKKAQHIANHNTVKVYDFDRDGEVVFMTMEYMVGQPLDQMVKQYHATGLPPNEAWNILKGMCSALIHAHDEDIVHSDLKPGNVFVTNNGTAKIFDFGIARAVQKIDRSNSEQDRTVFDAGNLGALTPAYASREMLLGQVPDVRDDIYALGCIAYELLTGDHPFTRLPADEAHDKKLKPKRIQGIKKRHWKAIEAALAFERKDRIVSVEAFYKQITESKRSNGALWFGALLTLGAAAFAYQKYTAVEVPAVSQAELMNQMEFKIRYQVLQENIERFIAAPSFSTEWQHSLWEEMQSVAGLFPEKPTPWYFTKREAIYKLYLEQINEAIQTEKFDHANVLLNNASRYSDEQTELDQQKFNLANKIAEKEKADKEAAEVARIAAINAEKKAAQQRKANKAIQAKKVSLATKKENTNLYNLAMGNVNEQLNCAQRLNMRDFKIAIEKLRTLDNNRYKESEKTITKNLASCITIMGQESPVYARDAKRYALLLFNNNATIASVVIKEKDGCQLSIAGLGARGTRAVCKDTLKSGGVGPTMVVIPGTNKIKPFAIGRYEVSIAQYNVYCTKSKECSPVGGSNRLPINNISLGEMIKYTQWLSKDTGKTYRLPHKREWQHAAQSKGNKLDPNRNCQISSRGIQKGDELIKTTTGKQNTWGVVNYAGNAQEIAYISSKKIAALGGSYQASMDDCTGKTVNNHTGEGDEHTGFRVVRNLVDG